MQPEITLTQLAMAIQLLHEKEQETMRLLQCAQDQNQALLAQHQQQQALVAHQQQIIERLLAELRAFRSAQQSTFGPMHAN